VPVFDYIIVAVAAYLLGSIPFGFLVAKAKGVDIRSVGSGNIGATNAMRVLGKPAGIFVLLMDALKGYAAVKIFSMFMMKAPPYDDASWHSYYCISVIAGVGAVLGHNYTCWLKFKGGKGIATSAGVYLALAPWALLAALVIFILAVLITKYVSVGSIAAAIALAVTVWIMTPQNVLLGVVTTALAVLAIYKHKSNIQRLMAGTESRLGQKPEDKK
jgi:acyl phosphate:glycerol-3-phosphate acyltransferase